MKVIHLIGGGDVGGAKTHVLSLISRLSRDIEVVLVPLREGEFAEDARKMGIDVRVIHSKNPISDLKALKELIISENFDVVHCHGAKANVMGALVRKLCKKPVVTTVHSDYRLDYMGSPLKQYTNGALNTVSLRCLDGYIGVTDNFTDMLIKRGFDPYHVYTIYNGLDFDYKPCPKLSRAEYLSSLGMSFDDDTVVCGIAARLHPVKDIGTIVRAMARLRESCPNLRLIIAGDGEQMSELRAQVKAEHLEERVFFAGWVTDMDTYLGAIDINLLSSLSESFPYSVLEAVRAGCTMVTSSVGGMPVLIDHGANGFLFTPRDDVSLAEHLKYLYENPTERRAMAQRLYEKASHLYSLENMAKTQLDIYRSVLSTVEADKARRNQVTVCGSYGKGNAGDDAILNAVIREVGMISPASRVCVMSRKPGYTRVKCRVRAIYPFNPFKMAGAILKSKVYLNGGGSLIQDSTSSRSLYFYLFTIICAKLFGCRVMMYGCGIGPVRRPFNRRLAGAVINRFVDTVTLRDPNSVTELESMKVSRPKMTLAADPTLILSPAKDEEIQSAFFREGLSEDGAYAAFAMRSWHGIDKKIPEIAKACDYVAKECGLTPVLIPMEYDRDLPIAKRIAQAMEQAPIVIRNRYDVHTVIGILSRMKLIVAMRLHALVFGAGAGVPVIGIAYDHKVSGFMSYVGQTLCTPYETFDFETLKNLINLALNDEDTAALIREAAVKMRQNEAENVRAAKELFL